MTTDNELPVQLLHHRAKLPTRGSQHSAGLDLCACETAVVPPQSRAMISTGLAVAIPAGHYGRIAARSGMALSSGIDVLAGVVDADYRGELRVLLYNTGERAFNIFYGDRIAQLVIERIAMLQPMAVGALPDSVRGEDGFGSTGY
jgi:deoxyuridine 5'-triphosphate nucleotidohydrolase